RQCIALEVPALASGGAVALGDVPGDRVGAGPDHHRIAHHHSSQVVQHRDPVTGRLRPGQKEGRDNGTPVSPDTGKPLSAAQLAEIEPSAGAQLSDPAGETETPEETDVAPGALAVNSDGALKASVKGGKWKTTHIT
ncbi:hypothetical protein, partial [Streptomyces sp. NPDC087300]|uniref:hypothetical protein n=1 Tax=Streptomyces sp. NPDC087300 TaxID=3365780 RepID=UPI00381E3675